MTAADLLSDLELMGPQDRKVLFRFVVDYMYEFRLSDGSAVRDVTDLKLFFEECVALLTSDQVVQ